MTSHFVGWKRVSSSSPSFIANRIAPPKTRKWFSLSYLSSAIKASVGEDFKQASKHALSADNWCRIFVITLLLVYHPLSRHLTHQIISKLSLQWDDSYIWILPIRISNSHLALFSAPEAVNKPPTWPLFALRHCFRIIIQRCLRQQTLKTCIWRGTLRNFGKRQNYPDRWIINYQGKQKSAFISP